MTRPLPLILLGFVGCHNPAERLDDHVGDLSWRVSLPLEHIDLIDEDSYGIDSFWEVTASELPVALHTLGDQVIVDVTDYEPGPLIYGIRVADLPPVGPTSRRFLVRGTYYKPETGGFGLYYDRKRLWVSHSCLGKKPVPLKETVLLVVLPSPPDVVYVDASMDE